MEKETKAPEKLPWDGNEEFDKYLDTYLKNAFKGVENGTRKYIPIPYLEEFEEKFEDDDRYVNVLIPLYTAFLNDALYSKTKDERNQKLLSLWYHVQSDVVPFNMTFPDETEDFMLTLNVAVVNLVWEKFEKKNERKNK